MADRTSKTQTIRLDPALLERINAVRGGQSLTAWLADAAARFLDGQAGNVYPGKPLDVPFYREVVAQPCHHPKDRRESLGYMTRCGVCGARV